jgi:glyoxylase-like metal-dependent hydrolase (beta-lactamase superfamily II)
LASWVFTRGIGRFGADSSPTDVIATLLRTVLLERIVCGRARSNAYVYAPVDERALIVDAGMGAARRVIDIVGAEGLHPQALVLTHGHPDHIWTARELSDRYEIPAFIHTDDVTWFVDPATGVQLPIVRAAGRALARVRRLRPHRLEGVDDGRRIEAGPFAVTVLHTPGHSRGSACLLVDGICFAGDTVFKGSVGQAMFPGGDRIRLAESIRTKLLPLPDDVRLLPGHGRETSVGDERGAWERYLRAAARERSGGGEE